MSEHSQEHSQRRKTITPLEDYSDTRPEEIKHDEWQEKYEELKKESDEKIALLEERCTQLEAQVATSLHMADESELAKVNLDLQQMQ